MDHADADLSVTEKFMESSQLFLITMLDPI
jgi:hypothetical protein